MTPTPEPAAAQLRFLAGGLVLIAGLLTIATVAATQVWLSLLAGVLLFLLALAGIRHEVSRLLVVITLGFALVLLAGAVVQWEAEDAPAEAAADTARAPAPILISGTVSESGRPLSGVPVQVTLWPSADETEIGGRIDTLDLPPVRTDGQGRYVVTLAPEDVPHRYLMDGRRMNFEVATTDPRIAPLSTSARYLPRIREWVDALGDRDSEPKTLDFDLGSMEATETGDGSRRWPLFSLDLDPAGN